MSVRRYYTDMIDRAVRTAAQSAILALGADQVNVLDLDFATLAGFAGGGFVLSLLTTLVIGGVTGRTDSSPPHDERGAISLTPVDLANLERAVRRATSARRSAADFAKRRL